VAKLLRHEKEIKQELILETVIRQP